MVVCGFLIVGCFRLGFGSGCVAFLLGWCGWCGVGGVCAGGGVAEGFLGECLGFGYCWVVMGVASFGVLVVTLMCFVHVCGVGLKD